mgnify:CR=1 FL=1
MSYIEKEISCQEISRIWSKFKPRDIIDTIYLGDVKVVAVKGTAPDPVGDWAAYIGHSDQADEKIAVSGHKLPMQIARAIFDQKLLECHGYRR